LVDGWPTKSQPAANSDREEISWVLGSRHETTNELADGNPRHSGGFSILFCDGYVKHRKRELKGSIWTGGTRSSEWAARADD